MVTPTMTKLKMANLTMNKMNMVKLINELIMPK
jgi:hypothetical protein